MTINGAACGLTYVSRHRIDFVVPPGLASSTSGTIYPLVITNNGVTLRSTITIVPARPDIFNILMDPAPGGRAKVFNVTNRVFTAEPFTVTTKRIRPFGRTATILRVYATGVSTAIPSNASIRISTSVTTGITIRSAATLIEPGVYTIDFALPPDLEGVGDQPIILTVTLDGIAFTSRLDDTASRLRIL